MMYKMTIEQLVDKLREIALQEAWDDDPDFMVDDYAGGNEDDAFYGGQRSGEIILARQLLTDIGVEYARAN